MVRAIRFLLLVILLGVSFSASSANALSKENERINGVADYLIDRAKENYFYIFEKKIKDNTALKCYFSTTYSYVAEGDLKLLLTSRGIWDSAINMDLDALVARAVAKQIVSSVDFHQAAMEATNFYADILQYISVTIEGTPYPLNVMPMEASEDIRNTINGFYHDFLNLRRTMEETGKKLSPFKNICTAPALSTAELSKVIDELAEATRGLDAWLKHVTQYKDALKVDMEALERDCARDPTAKVCQLKAKASTEWVPALKKTLEKPTLQALGAAVFLAKYVSDIQQAQSNTNKVLIAVKGLRESGLDKTIELDKFKHHILFFAQISDATEAEEVSALLSDYTLPAVSFFVKREKNTSHILVSAYLGYGYGKVLNESKAGDDNKSGVVAPIGLEYSYGTKGEGAWSVMLAPFDFGYPVSLKLHGITEDVDLDEIIAPGVYLAYGVPEYPLNVGLAYQQGRKVGVGNDAENRAFFFISFDMPLLTLY